MKTGLLLIFFLCISTSYAVVQTSIIDDFGSGVTCPGSSFDCGSTSDGIIDPNGDFNVNLTDDGLATYVCATSEHAGVVTTRSCIIRNGFNTTICDSIISTVTPSYNKTNWYTCSSTNLSQCGWNGGGGIPRLGVSPIVANWQIDTGIVNTSPFSFISYYCNVTPKVSFQPEVLYFRVVTTKGAVCNGLSYQSSVYDSFGISSLGGNRSCADASFCDPALAANFTMYENITGNFCTPGCYDGLRNGGETEVDYGGVICGNCTGGGKRSDEYYGFAREIQQSRGGRLSTINVFDPAYCSDGADAGNASYLGFFFMLLISGITFLLLVGVSIAGLLFAGTGIVRFIKKKR